MSDIFSLISQSATGLFHLLVFPGGLFALLFGLVLKGIDRKVEARLQRRVGPPLLQPFYDLVKLASKETIIPETANKTLFLYAPLLGFTGMAVCLALLPVPGVYYGMENMGDMLVFFYLLPLPAIALMVAGSSSSSPFGALGFSREMTLMFAYEVPLLLVILAVAMQVGGEGSAEFSLRKIIEYQREHGSFGFTLSMLPAFVAYMLYLPGTMGVPPFDVAEAETEILEGPLLEYSGGLLAFFQLTSAMKLVIALGFGVVMFFPGTVAGGPLVNIVWFAAKCLLLMLVALTLCKAATARMRIEQALSFYLKYPAALALVSVVLAWVSL